jgi:hypothetical protein
MQLVTVAVAVSLVIMPLAPRLLVQPRPPRQPLLPLRRRRPRQWRSRHQMARVQVLVRAMARR